MKKIRYCYCSGHDGILERKVEYTHYGDPDLAHRTLIHHFIGICDKNDKPIYEGDLIKCDSGEMGIVTYMPEVCLWSLTWACYGLPYRTDLHTQARLENSPYRIDTSIIEVLGNIWENEDLVKKELDKLAREIFQAKKK
jgi:uncharacterized phage protein (TIGR01671 family)